MSSVIEQYDCVVGLLEDVSGLSTPKRKTKNGFISTGLPMIET